MTPVTRNLLFQRRQKRRVRCMMSWCMATRCCSAWRCGAAAHGIVEHGVVRCGVAGPIPTLRYLRPARQQRDNQRVVPPPTPEPPATPAVQRRRDVRWRRQTGGIRSHGREPSGSRGAWARGAFGVGIRSWQDYALMRSQALDDGKMLARCVPQRPTVAGLRPDAPLA